MIQLPMAALASASSITVSEGLLRREAVLNALTDLRLEGLKPSTEIVVLLGRYSNGEINEAELIGRALAR
jgi:Antitoxin VbhA